MKDISSHATLYLMDAIPRRLYPVQMGDKTQKKVGCESALSQQLSQPYSPRFVLDLLCTITIIGYKST
jgi:hypothetical protein